MSRKQLSFIALGEFIVIAILCAYIFQLTTAKEVEPLPRLSKISTEETPNPSTQAKGTLYQDIQEFKIKGFGFVKENFVSNSNGKYELVNLYDYEAEQKTHYSMNFRDSSQLAMTILSSFDEEFCRINFNIGWYCEERDISEQEILDEFEEIFARNRGKKETGGNSEISETLVTKTVDVEGVRLILRDSKINQVGWTMRTQDIYMSKGLDSESKQ